MTAEKGPEGSVPAEAAQRPFTLRMMVVVGLSAVLLLAGVAGATVWLWPKAPDAAEAKVTHAAPRRAAAQAAPPAAASATSASSDATDAHQAASPIVARDATPRPASEAPLDRLQRRLGEVLGGKGAIDASRSGELHVVARAGSVV